MKHSYILELKYLTTTDTDKKAEQQWGEAVTQIQGYGKGTQVKAMTEGTTLHLIVAQIRGYDPVRLEEIAAD